MSFLSGCDGTQSLTSNSSNDLLNQTGEELVLVDLEPNDPSRTENPGHDVTKTGNALQYIISNILVDGVEADSAQTDPDHDYIELEPGNKVSCRALVRGDRGDGRVHRERHSRNIEVGIRVYEVNGDSALGDVQLYGAERLGLDRGDSYFIPEGVDDDQPEKGENGKPVEDNPWAIYEYGMAAAQLLRRIDALQNWEATEKHYGLQCFLYDHETDIEIYGDITWSHFDFPFGYLSSDTTMDSLMEGAETVFHVPWTPDTSTSTATQDAR